MNGSRAPGDSLAIDVDQVALDHVLAGDRAVAGCVAELDIDPASSHSDYVLQIRYSRPSA
jgi:hypothetical protein